MQQIRQLIPTARCCAFGEWLSRRLIDLLDKGIECLHIISSHACSWCCSDCLIQLGPSSLDAILFGLDQPLYLSLLIFTCCTSLLFSSSSPFWFFLLSWLFLTIFKSKSVCLQFHSVCMTESSTSVDKSQCNTDRCDFDQKFGYQNHREITINVSCVYFTILSLKVHVLSCLTVFCWDMHMAAQKLVGMELGLPCGSFWMRSCNPGCS